MNYAPDMKKLEVVIPTRNRNILLLETLANLNLQTYPITKVYIVDSSDIPLVIENQYRFELNYIHTGIQSAAIQRNIGLSSVSIDCSFVGFIDDDVRVPRDYFKSLIDILNKSDGIGACGITSDSVNSKTNTPAFIFKRLFFLNSKKNGHINKAGINTPIKFGVGIVESDWLLGCAVWNLARFKALKFEESLHGLSLGEDVLISIEARKLGKLFVDSNLIIEHLQSKIARPNEIQFWKMWASNRKKIIYKMTDSKDTNFYYFWANFGQILSIIFFHKKNLISKIACIRGIIQGTIS